MINTVQQALEDVYVALGGQEDIDRLTVSQVLAKIYNVLGGTGDHGQETVPQLIDLIATVAPSGGGGGGGDFSVANVTFVNNTASPYAFDAPSYFVEGEEAGSSPSAYAERQRTSVVPIILYKGVGFAYLDVNPAPTLSATGDIEIDDTDLIISGDGTVTISE